MKNALHLSSLALSWLSVLYLTIFSTSLTASDSAEHFNTCNRSPVITCPQNFFGCLGDDTSPASVGSATAVAGENDCEVPVVTFEDEVEGADACAGGILIKRTWRADYPDGADPWLFAECTQVILLEDDELPLITDCPTNITVDPDNGTSATVAWAPPFASDDCGIVFFESNVANGSVFPTGVTTVIYTARDACGNESSCSFTVTVTATGCQDVPTISCPPNFTGCVGQNVDPAFAGMPTASFADPTCGTPNVTFRDVVISTGGSCAQNRTIERTWTAMNGSNSNLSASCVQLISLEDNQPPVVTTCQEDVEHSTISPSGIVIIYDDPIVSDDCGIASVVPSIPSGSVFTPGVTTVTFTITDLCGNIATCSFDITVILVQCQDPPILNCPDTFEGCIGSGSDPSITGMATASFSSSTCMTTPEVTFSDEVISTGPCAGAMLIERTWTATNPDDLTMTSSCVQTINIGDQTVPTIVTCPQDIVVGSTSTSGRAVNFPNVVATDDCGISSVTYSRQSGSVFPLGTTTVIVTVTDACGNSNTCFFSVQVLFDQACQESPNITCPTNISMCVGESTDPAFTGRATASFSSNNCSSDAIITFSDQVVATGTCANARTIQRTWTATNPDNSVLTSSCTQVITIDDTQAPVISQCPADITQTTSSPSGIVVMYSQPVVSDDCGIASSSFSKPSGSVFTPGVTTVTFTVTDLCGRVSTCSFTVSVTVTMAGCQSTPSMSCPADFTGCPGTSTEPSVTGMATGSFGSAAGCPASPSITFTDQIISQGPCNGAITLNRIWTATNSDNGQSVNCIQRITLVDTQAPTITNCPANATISSSQPIYTWAMPTVSDNCGGTSITSNIANGSSFPIGTTTVVLTATDACGNNSSCSFTVTVVQAGCQATPTISCPASYTACPGSSIEPSVTGMATGSFGSASGCPSSPTISFSDQIVSQGPCSGAVVINRIWTASNPDDGQSVTCTQRITLVDSQAPTLTNCPADTTILVSQANYSWMTPTVNDNCGATLTSDVANGSQFPIGSTTVTLTARDNCGNTTTCSFVVTVEEETTTGGGTGGGGSGSGSLSVTCPSDMIMACDDNGSIELPQPQVSSTCDLCTGGDISGFLFLGNFRGTNYYLSRTKATWPYARTGATNIGGFLARIESSEENAFLASRLPVSSAYIGLSDEAQEGTFRWTDGSSPSYTNWYPRQPNDYKGNQDYVELLQNGLWNDQFNYQRLLFIVEIPCVTVRQTAGPTTLKDLNRSTRVEFEVTDACGNVETCSFGIEVQQRLSVECPDDIRVETTANGAYVSYDLPEVTTCCTSASAQARSIPGFVYMGYLNGSNYYCSRNSATWSQANATARSLGGYLATIESPGENSFLARQLITQTAFVGISDHITEGRFFSVNNRPVNYASWDANQPSNTNGNQHFVEINPYGLWNDVSAQAKREYIMEVPADVRFTLVEGLPSGAVFPVGTTTVTVRATDACGVSETCSFDVTVSNPNTGGNTFCRSFAQRSDLGYIDETKVGNLLFRSGNNGGFADLTEYCLDVYEGGEFDLRLTPGFRSQAYLAYYHFYIDFNGDGDFEDTRELIGTSRSSNVIAGTFPIPVGTKNGQIRMRIVMSLNGFPESPCDVIGFGEVEDYCLNVRAYRGEALAKSRSTNGIVKLQGQGIERGIDFDQRDQEDIKLTISPNPVSHMMSIDYNAIDVAEAQIIDLKGQVVKTIDDLSTRIDVSDFSSGMYLLRVMHEDGTSKIEKFIVE